MEEVFKQELNDMPLDMLLGAAGAYADIYNTLISYEPCKGPIDGIVRDKMIRLTEAVNKRFQDMEGVKNV